VLVQEPASAKFDSMPRCAIEAGLADIVAPAEELPGKLIAYSRYVPQLGKLDLHIDGKTRAAWKR
jgi:two-component system CheB/CheR fusion protein